MKPKNNSGNRNIQNQKELERETRFELATFCLGSRHSTAELLPPLAISASGSDIIGYNPIFFHRSRLDTGIT
jgi:hypothetical protein